MFTTIFIILIVVVGAFVAFCVISGIPPRIRITVPKGGKVLASSLVHLVHGATISSNSSSKIVLVRESHSGVAYMKNLCYPIDEANKDEFNKYTLDCTGNVKIACQLFREQAAIQSRFDHPNIPKVLAFGYEDITVAVNDGWAAYHGYDRDTDVTINVPFSVMPFVAGETIENTVSTFLNNFPDVARILSCLANILDHIHGRGYIHRDVSPSSIMIDSNRKPHMIDFWLTVSVNDAATVAPNGRLGYVAPEIINNIPIDHRVDIYALGAVGYYLATGKPAFSGSTMKEVVEARLHHKPPLPSSVPRGLSEAISKALQKDPSDRFQTAAEAEKAFRVAEEKPCVPMNM